MTRMLHLHLHHSNGTTKRNQTPSWTATSKALSVFLSLVKIPLSPSICCRVDWVTEDVLQFFLASLGQSLCCQL